MSVFTPKRPERCPYCAHDYHRAPALCGQPQIVSKGKPCLCRAMPKFDDERKPEEGHTWEGSDDRD